MSHLFDDMKSLNLIGKSPRAKVLKHLKVVVLDLYIAYLQDPKLFIGYPRSPRSFAKGTRFNQLFIGYRPMMRVVDGLEDLGFIENHKGFFDQDRQTGFQSRMRATPSLIDLIEKGDVTPLMVSYDLGETIILRDAEDNDLSFPETEETRAISDQVTSYNEFLSEHRISLSLDTEEIRKVLLRTRSSSIDYTRTQLCRIFSQDFTSGGRYYKGWWQEVPSELRRYITIDGENCSELDYSGQSLGLLYAFKGHERAWLKGEGDPYAIEGGIGVERALMKQVFITCVNAASRDQAVLSIRGDINKGYKGINSTTVFIDRLIDKSIDNHPDIAECFFSSAWAGLQYQDSKIAEYVLKHMQAYGYVALPIHDSFVTQDNHLGQLFSLMKEAYRMLGVGSVPDIKREVGANSNPEDRSFQLLQELMEKESQSLEKELEAIKALEKV
jgi:hypothetical protein